MSHSWTSRKATTYVRQIVLKEWWAKYHSIGSSYLDIGVLPNIYSPSSHNSPIPKQFRKYIYIHTQTQNSKTKQNNGTYHTVDPGPRVTSPATTAVAAIHAEESTEGCLPFVGRVFRCLFKIEYMELHITQINVSDQPGFELQCEWQTKIVPSSA